MVQYSVEKTAHYISCLLIARHFMQAMESPTCFLRQGIYATICLSQTSCILLEFLTVLYVFYILDKTHILEELISTHSLDKNEIMQLFDRSDRYIIPYLQTYVKRHGLVLYNTEGREGAELETKTMNDSLVKAGFHTKMKEWKYSYELFLECTELMSSGLSLLVVSIMSHGTAGTLKDSGGSMIAITDILSSLKSELPEKLPLVSSYHLYHKVQLRRSHPAC